MNNIKQVKEYGNKLGILISLTTDHYNYRIFSIWHTENCKKYPHIFSIKIPEPLVAQRFIFDTMIYGDVGYPIILFSEKEVINLMNKINKMMAFA